MKHDTFIGRVWHRTRLNSRGDAERAAHARLSERLARGEADDLAAHLPPELGEHLRSGEAALGERFSLEAFFRRVSLRESVDLPDALFHARAVIEATSQAVSKGEMDDGYAQLPSEFAHLFDASSTSQMPGKASA